MRLTHCKPLHRGTGRCHNARLSSARPRVPLARLAKSRADGASMCKRPAFYCTHQRPHCNYKYKNCAAHNRYECVCVRTRTRRSSCDEIIAVPAWQLKSTRDGRANRGAHSSRKDDQHTRAGSARTSHPQQNAPSSVAHEPPPYSNSENSARATAEQAKSTTKPRSITCYKCGESGHVVSACNSDARPARKCYACNGIGHMACDCATRAAQAKAQTSNSSSNAVTSAGKGAAQVFAPASIAGLGITDALINTISAF